MKNNKTKIEGLEGVYDDVTNACHTRSNLDDKITPWKDSEELAWRTLFSLTCEQMNTGISDAVFLIDLTSLKSARQYLINIHGEEMVRNETIEAQKRYLA